MDVKTTRNAMTTRVAGPDRQIEEHTSGKRARRDEYKVRGEKAVAKLKELLHEGNVRHVVLKNEEGKTLIEFPVTVGVAGALLLPVWAAIGALGALVANCKIEVEREE
jgi:hypothetical protein